MDEQGSSELGAGLSERILDRLSGLEKLISPLMVRQVVNESGRRNAERSR